tara:strand:- start:91 stop:261 length:171 start_codon:yes stop_codon:yes gene_type:complete
MHRPKSNRLVNVSKAVCFAVLPIRASSSVVEKEEAFQLVVVWEDNDIGISLRGQQK